MCDFHRAPLAVERRIKPPWQALISGSNLQHLRTMNTMNTMSVPLTMSFPTTPLLNKWPRRRREKRQLEGHRSSSGGGGRVKTTIDLSPQQRDYDDDIHRGGDAATAVRSMHNVHTYSVSKTRPAVTRATGLTNVTTSPCPSDMSCCVSFNDLPTRPCPIDQLLGHYGIKSRTGIGVGARSRKHWTRRI